MMERLMDAKAVDIFETMRFDGIRKIVYELYTEFCPKRSEYFKNCYIFGEIKGRRSLG